MKLIDKLIESLEYQPGNSWDVARYMVGEYNRGTYANERAYAQKRQDIYEHNWLSHLDVKLRSQFASENYERLFLSADVSYNLLRRVNDRTAVVYSEPATRKLDAGDNTYQELLKILPLNNIMDYVNKMTELHWVIGAIPCVRDNKPGVDIILPGVARVATTPMNPLVPVALLYETRSESIDGKYVKYYQYIDRWQMFTLDGEGARVPNEYNPEDINPYGVLPLVVARKSTGNTCFWEPFASADLVEGSLIVGGNNTFIGNALKTSCFKQIATDAQDMAAIPKNQRLDPTTLLSGANFSVLDLQIQLKQISDEIDRVIRNICTAYGMSYEEFTMSAAPTSGFARKLANQHFDEQLNRQRRTMLQVEKDLYSMMAKVYNQHDIGIGRLSEDAELSVDFAEEKYDDSPQEQLKQDLLMQKNNLMSTVDIYRKYINPDATDGQAMEAIKKNKQINQSFSALGALFSSSEPAAPSQGTTFAALNALPQ